VARSREFSRHCARLRNSEPLPMPTLRPWVRRAAWLAWCVMVALALLASFVTFRGF
jgi:cytochrome b561